MVDLIDNFKKNIKNNLDIVIPLLLFFVSFLVFNFLAPHSGHDEGWGSIFDAYGGLNWNSFKQLTSDWFYKHNNRIPIELLAILFVQKPFGIILYRIINPIFATIVFYLILKTVNSKKIIINVLLFLVILTIDGALVYDVGLVSVSTNYIWPVAVAAPAFVISLNLYRNKNKSVNITFFILSIILLIIFSLWSEMFCLVFGAILVVFSIMHYTKFKKVNIKYVVYFLLAVGFFVFAYLAPSTKVRYNNTIKYNFPTYASFSFLSKCWFGIVETYNDYMKIFNLLFILLLVYATFVNKKTSKLLKINSLMPVLHFVIYNSLFNSYVLKYNSGISEFYSKYIRIISTSSSIKPTATGVPFLGAFIAIIFFSHVLISLIFLNINKEEKIILISCFLIGLGSKVCLGFTPRYYVTYRTNFYVVLLTLVQMGIIMKQPFIYECKKSKMPSKTLNNKFELQ